MAIRDIVNSNDWEEVETIIEQKLHELLLDFPNEEDPQAIALHALANKKAYTMLTDFLEEANFYQGEERVNERRQFI